MTFSEELIQICYDPNLGFSFFVEYGDGIEGNKWSRRGWGKKEDEPLEIIPFQVSICYVFLIKF